MDSKQHYVQTYTFGCKVNLFDSMAMESALSARGAVINPKAQVDPQAVIVNTCTVTASADEQAAKLLRKISRKHPGAKIIVTGCSVQHVPQKFSSLSRNVEILPIREQFKLPQLVGYSSTDTDQAVPVVSRRTRANLKMQDGCNAYCSYCILPYVRGRSRSIPLDQILDQVSHYQKEGHSELILTGTHLGAYGRDLNPRITLRSAIESIFDKSPTTLLRISSLEPSGLTDSFLDLVASEKRIQPHFHIPLQSGSNAILKKMNRKYKAEHFSRKIERLFSANMPTIGTDVIVGFPGESQDNFSETYDLLESLPIHYFHVFPYSPRPGTAANRMTDDVPNEIKQERVHRLRDLSFRKKKAWFERFACSESQVFVEYGRDQENRLSGITPHYIAVRIDGPDRLMGRMIDVQLEKLCGSQTGEPYFLGKVI